MAGDQPSRDRVRKDITVTIHKSSGTAMLVQHKLGCYTVHAARTECKLHEDDEKRKC
jgi:hypothetical protein